MILESDAKSMGFEEQAIVKPNDEKNKLIGILNKPQISNDTLIMYSLGEKSSASLESTTSQFKKYIDYLNSFHEKRRLKIEMEKKARLETFERTISINYLASFQLNPLEYKLNSYIGDEFASAIRFYPQLFTKLSENINSGLKKYINSEEYKYAKSALGTLIKMYNWYISSAIFKSLDINIQKTFTQLVELNKSFQPVVIDQKIDKFDNKL